VAVLAIVGFHGFPAWITGGFIGVDIFFVISGFLISTIIIGSLERNTFNFGDFYSRRIKRIFPALLVVLISCFILGWFSLLTDEYQQLGKHITAGAGFVSNLFFWAESGYFDNAAETKPLLHLWSLGIEEQFYIFWPVLLWLGSKKRINLGAVILAIAAISFGLNIYQFHRNPTADFYSPQTRFWELLIGAILAYIKIHKSNFLLKLEEKAVLKLNRLFDAQPFEVNMSQLQNGQSFLGAVLIVISALVITKGKAFPGFLALLPTLGAVLIISAGAKAWLNRTILSNRILVWIGLISYPLYLWHWPVLTFARILFEETPSAGITIGLIAFSFILAWLTYRFVEKPLRFGEYSNVMPIMLAIMMGGVGFVGYITFIKAGLPVRYHLSINDPLIRGRYADRKGEAMQCQDLVSLGSQIPETYFSKTKGDPTVAVLGDSHAGRLFSGFRNSTNDQFSEVIALYATSCKMSTSFFEEPERCKEFLKTSLAFIKSTPSIKYVVITLYYALPDIRKNSESGDRFLDGFGKTIEQLEDSNKQVVFVMDNPELKQSPKLCIPYPLKLRELYKDRPLFCSGATDTDFEF